MSSPGSFWQRVKAAMLGTPPPGAAKAGGSAPPTRVHPPSSEPGLRASDAARPGGAHSPKFETPARGGSVAPRSESTMQNPYAPAPKLSGAIGIDDRAAREASWAAAGARPPGTPVPLSKEEEAAEAALRSNADSGSFVWRRANRLANPERPAATPAPGIGMSARAGDSVEGGSVAGRGRPAISADPSAYGRRLEQPFEHSADQAQVAPPRPAVPAARATAAPAAGSGLFPARPPSSRDETRAKDFGGELQHVLQKLADLEQHLTSHEQRNQHMARSVDRFSGTLERLALVQQQQDDSLRALSTVSEHNGDAHAELTGSLSELPGALGQLADTLHAVLDRVIQSQETLASRLLEGQQTFAQQWAAQQEQVLARLDGERGSQSTLLSRLVQNQDQLLARLEGTELRSEQALARLSSMHENLLHKMQTEQSGQQDLHNRMTLAQESLLHTLEAHRSSQESLQKRLLAGHEALLQRLESGQSASEQIQHKALANQEALLQRIDGSQAGLAQQFSEFRQAQLDSNTIVTKFNQAVEELTATSRAGAETFKRIGITEMEQRHTLSRQVGKMGRRFTVFVTVTGGLLLGALSLIIGLMIMALDRPQILS